MIQQQQALLLEQVCEEVRLGHVIAQHPITLACAQAMARAALRYMQVRAERIPSFASSSTSALEQLILACGQPLDEPFAGRIGLSIEQLSPVFQGYGNVRELVTHTWRFMNNIFCHDVVGPNQIQEALLIAEQAGLNIAEIQQMTEHAQWLHASSLKCDRPSSTDQLNPKNDWIKMPWSKIRQAQERMRISKMPFDAPEAWSQITRDYFEAEGGCLSETEKRLQNPRGGAYIPWLDGRHLWTLDETDPFVRHARQAHIQLMTGISGFTAQIMQFCRILNPRSDIQARLVCLGYLLPIRAHSFHEVMSAAMPFGCNYNDDANYTSLQTLIY